MKRHGFNVRPFRDTVQGPVVRASDGWGWYTYPPVGGESWQGDYPTRADAREARRAQQDTLRGSGAAAEHGFERGAR